MKPSLTFIFILALSFAPKVVLAQEPEMADEMRAQGKIYVVVAIVLVVLLGLIIYLFTVDRKVSRLEKSSDKS